MANLSSSGAPRSLGLRRRIALAVVLCLATTGFHMGTAESASAAKPSKGSGTSAVLGTTVKLPIQTLAPPDPCDPWDPECVNEPANCWVSINNDVSRGSNYSRIDFGGHISCYGTGYVYVQGSARLVDRTPGYSGNTIAAAPSIYQPVEYGHPAHSSRVIDLYDQSYPAGQQAEVRFEFSAQQEFGVWNGCGPDAGSLRFDRCDGAGTSTLYVEVVTNIFSTQVTCAMDPIPPVPPLIPPTPGPNGGPGEWFFDFGPGDCGPVVAADGISTSQAPGIRCTFSVQQPHLEGTLIGGYARIKCINLQTLAPIKMAMLAVTATMWKRTPWVLPTSPPEQYTPIIETTRHNSNLAQSEIEQFIVYSCPGPGKAWEYVISAAFFMVPAGRYREGSHLDTLGGISNFILC